MAGHYIPIPVETGPKTLSVGEGEVCRKVILLDSMPAEMPFDHVIASAGSVVDICIVILPGVDVDIPLAVDIAGPGADVSLSGVYICGGEEKVSLSTDVRHLVHDCTSNQTFNGIAGGHSHFKFFGHIVVAPDAQKTSAYQSSHNLLLSPGARIDAKPQLEIYADDVKCSHGAAIGQLNEDEQFYMRSRGIPEREAKALQMISFIAPVVSHITDDGLRESVSRRTEEAIRRIAM
jgi:Fe-S cluster assembly protein SufD